jgi:hypothetical protein
MHRLFVFVFVFVLKQLFLRKTEKSMQFGSFFWHLFWLEINPRSCLNFAWTASTTFLRWNNRNSVKLSNVIKSVQHLVIAI